MSGLRIVQTDKLCRNKVGVAKAYLASMPLIENGWCRYPAACWDKPAVLVFRGAACVAGLNYDIDPDTPERATINFAFCDGSEPKALALAALAFRRMAKALGCEVIRFSYHNGNRQMEKAARVIGAVVTLYECEVGL